MKKMPLFYKIFIIIVLILAAYLANEIQQPQVSTHNDRQEVQLAVCIDGDTARFVADGVEKKYRFLLIDTPESTTQTEAYGIEAAQFTCNALKSADKIEIEYQNGNDQQDQYGRELVWVFVDGKLLQTEIARAGYVKKLYDNQRPFDDKEEIIAADLQAQEAHAGIYSK